MSLFNVTVEQVRGMIQDAGDDEKQVRILERLELAVRENNTELWVEAGQDYFQLMTIERGFWGDAANDNVEIEEAVGQ